MLLFLSAATQSSVAQAVEAAAVEPITTSSPFASPSRYFLQSTVQLPSMMWFATPFNKQARTTGFDLRMVLDCEAGAPNTRHTMEVVCTIEDLALSATGMEQERGLLQPILTELDAYLTGEVMELQLRGHEVVNVGLDTYRRNRRVGRVNENLRLVVSRAVAGLDFGGIPGPVEGEAIGGWPEYGSMLTWIPSAVGTAGTTELVYKIVRSTSSTTSMVYGGSGVLVPGGTLDRYDTRVTGDLVLDAKTGRILDRTWLVAATPTPSSMVAQGYAGYPYLQQGRVVALQPGQAWDVGESLELETSEYQPSAIQQQFQLGTGYPR